MLPLKAATFSKSGIPVGKSKLPLRSFAKFRRDRDFINDRADQPFDPVEFIHIVLVHHRKCNSSRFCPRCPANPVHIILGIVRHIIIDHQVDILDIYAAAHHIRCD